MTATQNTFNSIARIHITKLRATTTTTSAKNRGQDKDRKARRAWPTNKLAEAEIEFTDGFLAGHTLRGFTVWQRQDGDGFFVTPPQRSYEKDDDKRYHSFLVYKNEVVRDQFQDLVLDEYRRVIAQRAASAESAEAADATAQPTDDEPSDDQPF